MPAELKLFCKTKILEFDEFPLNPPTNKFDV